MPNSWTAHQPIALPPRSLAYAAAALLGALVVFGVASGFLATLRQASAPGVGGEGAAQSADGALIAKPIVEIQAPTAAEPADAQADKADASADAQDIASQAAAAQAVQAKPSKAGGNIDDILTSPTEKPPAPVKAPDEAPPVKTDVPF